MTRPHAADDLSPIHPGEILVEEFMRPHGLSAIAVAKAVHVPRTRIERLVREEASITVDTARRLARLFGTTPAFWLALQAQYDLAGAQADDVDTIRPLAAAS